MQLRSILLPTTIFQAKVAEKNFGGGPETLDIQGHLLRFGNSGPPTTSLKHTENTKPPDVRLDVEGKFNLHPGRLTAGT